jgi:hypothetical protein
MPQSLLRLQNTARPYGGVPGSFGAEGIDDRLICVSYRKNDRISATPS